MIRLILAVMLASLPTLACASSKTWIVIGDSIMSYTADGTSNQHALMLVQGERSIFIRNISSPGAALGAKDTTGFNMQTTRSIE